MSVPPPAGNGQTKSRCGSVVVDLAEVSPAAIRLIPGPTRAQRSAFSIPCIDVGAEDYCRFRDR